VTTRPERLQIEARDDHLRVHIAGHYPDARESREIFLRLKAAADAKGLAAILVVATGLALPQSQIDRYSAGTLAAEVLGADQRLAIVFSAGAADKLMEDVAVNRGAQVFVAGSEKDALDWLRGA
jgi:hypothetical protein